MPNVFGTLGGIIFVHPHFLLTRSYLSLEFVKHVTKNVLKAEFKVPIPTYTPKYGTQGWNLGTPTLM